MPARVSPSPRNSSDGCARPSAPRRRFSRARPAFRDRRRGYRARRRRQAARRACASDFRGWDHELPVAPGDVVAAEHDQVGPLGHQRGHAARTSSCDTQRLRWTSVSSPTRKPPSADGRPATMDGLPGDLELVTRIEVTVRAGAGGGAHAGGDEALQHSPACDGRHRVIVTASNHGQFTGGTRVARAGVRRHRRRVRAPSPRSG